MQTLYIDRRDTRLDVDRERILVHSPSLPRPLSIAFTYLSSIVISAKTQLHSHVLLACASRGIPVIILDPRSCESHAQYIPPSSKVVHRKIKQFEVLDQDGRRLGYAKQLVYSQALQQYKLLRYWFKNREIEQTNQDQLIERLKTIIKMINTCQSLEQLRGLEGASAKIIFYTMSLLVPAWCKFKGRNRRPPRDPINVLLSLSYSLIYAECTRALTERIRTDIEKWVIQLILEEHLRPLHFTSSEQYPCVLNKDGRAIFYPLWERRFKVWKKYIRMNAQQWARTIDQS